MKCLKHDILKDKYSAAVAPALLPVVVDVVVVVVAAVVVGVVDSIKKKRLSNIRNLLSLNLGISKH